MKFTIEGFKSIYNPIELDFSENKPYSLIGENGVGKSNILKAINFFVNGLNKEDITKFYSKDTPLCSGDCHKTKNIKIIYENYLSKNEIQDIENLLKYSNFDIKDKKIFDNKKIIELNTIYSLYNSNGLLYKIIKSLIINLENKFKKSH